MTEPKGLTAEQVEELISWVRSSSRYSRITFSDVTKDGNWIDRHDFLNKIEELLTPKPRIIDADKLEEFILNRIGQFSNQDFQDGCKFVKEMTLTWIKDNAKINS